MCVWMKEQNKPNKDNNSAFICGGDYYGKKRRFLQD